MTIYAKDSDKDIFSAQSLVRQYTQADCLPSLAKGGGRIDSIRRVSYEDVDIFSGRYIDEVEINVRHEGESLIFIIPLEGGMEVKTTNGRTLDGGLPIAFEASDCRLLRIGAQRSHLRVTLSRQSIHKHLSAILEKPIVRPVSFGETLGNLAAAQAVAAAVKSLLLACKSEQAPWSEVATGLLAATLVEFWPHSHRDMMSADQVKVLPRHVGAAVEIIRSDPFGKMSLNELAKCVSVSPRALQYGFRQFEGTSVSEFRQMVKMESFRELLRRDKGDFAALKTRFPGEQISSMSRHYRAAFGVSMQEDALRYGLRRRNH